MLILFRFKLLISVTVVYCVWVLEKENVHGPHRHAVGEECSCVVGEDKRNNCGEVA